METFPESFHLNTGSATMLSPKNILVLASTPDKLGILIYFSHFFFTKKTKQKHSSISLKRSLYHVYFYGENKKIIIF